MAPQLSLFDDLRLQRHISLPSLLGGSVAPSRYFWPWLVKQHATADGHRFLRNVRDKYGPRAWSRLTIGRPLLVLDRDGISEVLASQDNFADPFIKKRPLSRFTPLGVIVSRNEVWKTRRNLNEEALAFGKVEPPGGASIVGIVRKEVQAMLEKRRELLLWDDFGLLAARISQQVIFGDGEFRPDFARHLAKLVAASNGWFRRPCHFKSFVKHIDDQFARQARTNSPGGSLVCRAARWLDENGRPADAAPSSQAAFWCFVIKDAIELHTVRTLALIGNPPADIGGPLFAEIRQPAAVAASDIVGFSFLEACIKEQLRLWTPVPILARVAVNKFELGTDCLRIGQQLLMHTGFYHRDPEVFGASAHRFSPEQRRTTDEANATSVTNSDPPLFVFSQLHQSCAGQFLAIFLLKTILAELLRSGRYDPIDCTIDINAVPASINHFALRFRRRHG